jgi:hypothetical protein
MLSLLLMLLLSLLASACAWHEPKPEDQAIAVAGAFTILGDSGQATVRVLTQAPSCPQLQAGDGSLLTMRERIAPGTVPARSDVKQPDTKDAVFDVRVCEVALPDTSLASPPRVLASDAVVPPPSREIRRIVIIADTGCRMKASENAFQACNDEAAWPFARVARSAAALKPDLVVHIGDMHYRESPCPQGMAACANSPWGYGYDAWKADFFVPARPLLAAAPWVFVRGNHESCARAGQGWFRFFDAQPWSPTRSCNEQSGDADADYSEPFAVPVASDTQFIVFDSSRTGNKGYKPGDEAWTKYQPQLERVAALASRMPHNWFMNHHPVLGFAPRATPEGVYPGNAGLQSVMTSLHGERLFAPGIDIALHGHVHMFEGIDFESEHPATMVLGNSGSSLSAEAPIALPPGAQPGPGARIRQFVSAGSFGFSTLEREGDHWTLVARDVDGRALTSCKWQGRHSDCQPVR